jgi:hypothetical protein
VRIANKLRIATRDTANAMEIACGEVESAVGVPVQPEFQEIDGTCLIVELRLVDETECTPHPHRLAHTVESYASNVEVLSSWKESNALRPKARFCHDVLGVDFDTMPSVALRALDDGLPTAQWQRSDAAWHLAVPALCREQLIIGLLRQRGYARRFASLDITALKLGLAS